MHPSLLRSLAASRAVLLAPALITVGLMTLLIATWWPTMPVVTAMTFVALGATLATVNCRPAAAKPPVILLSHAFVYSSLYILFIGAVCHASIAGPHGGLTVLQGLDLGASVMPMAVVVRLSLAAARGGGDAPVR